MNESITKSPEPLSIIHENDEEMQHFIETYTPVWRQECPSQSKIQLAIQREVRQLEARIAVTSDPDEMESLKAQVSNMEEAEFHVWGAANEWMNRRALAAAKQA